MIHTQAAATFRRTEGTISCGLTSISGLVGDPEAAQMVARKNRSPSPVASLLMQALSARPFLLLPQHNPIRHLKRSAKMMLI